MNSVVWPRVNLGQICEFMYGKSLPAARRNEGSIPVYGSNGVVGEHDQAVTGGPTIVVGRKGSYGEINYSPVPCWPIDTTYYIDDSATDVDLRWLAHVLPSLRLTELNRAAAVPGLNREDAYRQELLLPPLEDQRRIAAILDQADALRTKRRGAIAHFNDLRQAIFHDMFGPPDRYPKQKFGDAVLGFRYGTSNKSREGGYPALRIPNVIGGTLDLVDLKTVPVTEAEYSRLALREGDLLFVRTNGNPNNVGRCALVEDHLLGRTDYASDQFIYASYLIRARLAADVIDPIFAREYLSSPTGRRQLRERSKTSAGQFNINIAGLESLLLPAVPIEMQRTFAHRVQSVRKDEECHRPSASVLNELFASLQARAFSGRL